VSRPLPRERGVSSAEFELLRGEAIAYGEGRGGDVDPTTPDAIRQTLAELGGRPPSEASIVETSSALRTEVLAHLARVEQNRRARVEAARHRSARTGDGELVEGSLSVAEPTPQDAPRSWAEVLCARRGAL